jgi:hypothetical protein
MKESFLKKIDEIFEKLLVKYAGVKEHEVNEGNTYFVDYRFESFVLNIENYRREIYAALYKVGDSHNVVNLFNLLMYLNQGSPNVPEANYFKDEEDLEECYKKQLVHISSIVDDNFTIINTFFNRQNLDSKFKDIREFMIRKHPNLFRTV